MHNFVANRNPNLSRDCAPDSARFAPVACWWSHGPFPCSSVGITNAANARNYRLKRAKRAARRAPFAPTSLPEILSAQSEPGKRCFRRPSRTSKLRRLPPSLSCNDLRRAGEFTFVARRAIRPDFRPCKFQPNWPALFDPVRFDMAPH